MSLYPLILEMSLVEQESILNSILSLIEEEGWEVDESVTPEDGLQIVEEVIGSGELESEAQARMEAFGGALRKAVSRGARIAGKVARGVDRVRGGIAKAKTSLAMRKAKFRAGVKRLKHAAKTNFKAGRIGASVRGGKLSAAQKRQRSKAAAMSARKRKGKKVKRRMLPPRRK